MGRRVAVVVAVIAVAIAIAIVVVPGKSSLAMQGIDIHATIAQRGRRRG
jgi:hypothetical protein